MPSRSQYGYLHGGHLESSLIGRAGFTPSSEMSTSILNLELQRQNRRRHILRLEAHERNIANGVNVPTHQMEEARPMKPVPEKKLKDVETYSKELELWVKKMKCVTGMRLEQFTDIKVGVLDIPLEIDAVSIEPYPRLVEGQKYKLRGARDEKGQIKGKAIIEFENGDTINGFFVNGLRHGECRIETTRHGLTAIIGNYQHDKLVGKAKLLLATSEWVECFCKDGIQHGFARYFDSRGRLQMIGAFKSGRKSGVWWKMIRARDPVHESLSGDDFTKFRPKGGGAIVGRVNREGHLTGYRLAYIYPDFKTALVGSFVDGILDQAQEARLKTVVDDSGVKVPIFTEPNGPIYNREIATHDFMTSTPLLEDPYERQITEVRHSGIGGAGDGLYARVDIETNTVVAFYNGKRVRPKDWNEREHETWHDNAYKIFDPNNKKCTIDIPKEYWDFNVYRASFAHKTNHSFMPNAEFVSFEHPRFGLVPCILSTHDIKKGEEIFVHYGYDLQECPDWYSAAWEKGDYAIPDALRRAGYVDDDQDQDNATNGTQMKMENGSTNEYKKDDDDLKGNFEELNCNGNVENNGTESKSADSLLNGDSLGEMSLSEA